MASGALPVLAGVHPGHHAVTSATTTSTASQNTVAQAMAMGA